MTRLLPAALLAGLTATVASAGTSFPVINMNDSGPGSLRQAILDANANPGLDTITFAIPGPGVHTIVPLTGLDPLTDPVLINGYSQLGSSVNTDPSATNAVLLIELDGSVAGGTGLLLAGGSTVQGLVVNRWSTDIATSGVGGNVVQGNFIGTDPTGTVARGNSPAGLSISGPNDLIGGTSPADRNLVSGNAEGIAGQAPGVVIQGNLVGTDATGQVAIPNTLYGIVCNNSAPVIGGPAAGASNVISGNAWGVIIGNVSSNAVVQGNRIGTTAGGTGPLGNANAGIDIESGGAGIHIGGTGAGEANEIAFNAGPGVIVGDGLNNTVRGNSFHDNGGLGIDLNNDAHPNFNDAGDGDEGANHLQNFPILQSVTTGASTHIVGKFNSTASTSFDIDFYANPACPRFPRELLEGTTYLGTAPVTTDDSGNATIDVTLPVQTEAGARISATATDPNGNTSEFSQRILFSLSSSSGPAAGGTLIGVAGTDFADPTTLTFGGVATAVTFVDNHTLSTTSPALLPGTVNDVVAVTPDGTTGTLSKGWVSDFLDVPGGHDFYSFVTKLVSNAITAGVGGGLYGVDQPTLREQMAVFLLKAKHGLCYAPPQCQGLFADVPCPATQEFPFSDWIEQLFQEGITAGCSTGFCPDQPVTRAQMAVFLLKTEHGIDYTPDPCGSLFADVPCPATPQFPFSDWIERLYAEGITGGCQTDPMVLYCPDQAATRGQMAVFMVKTFLLQ